jgi:hypothetical protein
MSQTNSASESQERDILTGSASVERHATDTERPDQVAEVAEVAMDFYPRASQLIYADAMDVTRAAMIRGRILSGAYNTLELVDAVARRLLESGDL